MEPLRQGSIFWPPQILNFDLVDAYLGPDPAFYFDADPDPAFHTCRSGPDPDPASQNGADPSGSATLLVLYNIVFLLCVCTSVGHLSTDIQDLSALL
jgi:hypothetical protein